MCGVLQEYCHHSSPHVAKSVWPTPMYFGGSRKFPDEVVGFYKMVENSESIPDALTPARRIDSQRQSDARKILKRGDVI